MKPDTQAQKTQPTPSSVRDGHGTLKLASYQKPERREEAERRTDGRRAVVGERRTATQRVLRALFGT